MMNVVVVGAGLSGSIMAREIAEKCKCPVSVIEKRNHIAGNVYDEFQRGILIQKYGPHFIATFHWSVVKYLMQYADFYAYPVRAQSYVNGKYIERPYNFRTLQQLLGPENSEPVLRGIRAAFPNCHRATLREIMDCKDDIVSNYGKLLYSELFVPYCAKQWGMKVEDISAEVINRTDIMLGYETQLDDTDFQYLPKEGFTAMISNILAHPKISVSLGEDALTHMAFDDDNGKILYDGKSVDALYYTGDLDALFSYRYGELPYISRYFTYNEYETDKYLPCGVITYPKEQKYLRQTEFRHFNPVQGNCNHTIVQTEYALPMNKSAELGNEPYYPVLNDGNIALHNQYKQAARAYSNLFYGGRLGDYKYYDMDIAILNVFEDFKCMVEQGAVKPVAQE